MNIPGTDQARAMLNIPSVEEILAERNILLQLAKAPTDDEYHFLLRILIQGGGVVFGLLLNNYHGSARSFYKRLGTVSTYREVMEKYSDLHTLWDLLRLRGGTDTSYQVQVNFLKDANYRCMFFYAKTQQDVALAWARFHFPDEVTHECDDS